MAAAVTELIALGTEALVWFSPEGQLDFHLQMPLLLRALTRMLRWA